MKNLITLFLFLHCAYSFTQDNHKRYTFAKTYFGTDLYVVPGFGAGTLLEENKETSSFDRTGFITPAFNIGATHFWGYADFYVSISTSPLTFKKDRVKHLTKFGALTGLRVYPWPLNRKKIRPFFGYKFSPVRYQQETLNGDYAKVSKIRSILDVGLSYQTRNAYIYAGFNYIPSSQYEIALSRTEISSTNIPRNFFNLGINYTIETTYSSDNTVRDHFHKTFSQSNGDGFYLGLGLSAAIPIQSSSYVTDLNPYLDDKSMPEVFPDLGIGYHFSKPDIIIGLAGRAYTQKRKAFSFEQKLKRRSLVVETYKFMGDYHGFVPFLGLGLGLEHMQLVENEGGQRKTHLAKQEITPLLVFGWDIRPSRKGDWWVLRTNLRYSPFLTLESESKRLSLQHLEFNFIQFVVYPQRRKKWKAY